VGSATLAMPGPRTAAKTPAEAKLGMRHAMSLPASALSNPGQAISIYVCSDTNILPAFFFAAPLKLGLRHKTNP